MATFVGAFGVPHVPMFADMVRREGASSETARMFATAREALSRLRPDVIVMFDTDHLNTFFFDCLPPIAIGVVESFRGHNDEPPALDIQSDPALARYIRASSILADFDLAVSGTSGIRPSTVTATVIWPNCGHLVTHATQSRHAVSGVLWGEGGSD